MATRIENAQLGIITDEMREIARRENVTPKFIKDFVAQGRIAILKNKARTKLKPVAVGNNLKTKISANIATGAEKTSLEDETDKLRVMQHAKIDCVIDLSYGPYIEETKEMLLSNSNVPVGVNPLLQIGYEIEQNGQDLLFLKDDMFSLIKKNCLEGFDFICLSCALTKGLIEEYEAQGRLFKIATKEAQIMLNWIKATNNENPFYEYFDELLEILKENDVTLLINSAFKSACIADSFDSIQISEYIVISKLVKRALEKGVQVMVDGIGHMPINKIEPIIKIIKESTFNVPLFISNVNACDCAVGHDNISASIAQTLCVNFGANMLNVITSIDYLQKSTPADITEGIISAKIARNCANLANNDSDAMKQNYKISYAKVNNDFKNVIKNSIDKTVFEGIDLEH